MAPSELSPRSAQNLQKAAATSYSLSGTMNNNDSSCRFVKPESFLGISRSNNFADSSAPLAMRPTFLPLLKPADGSTVGRSSTKGSSTESNSFSVSNTICGTGAGFQDRLKPPPASLVDPRLWQQHCTAQKQYWTEMEKEAAKMAGGSGLGNLQNSVMTNNVPQPSAQWPHITPHWPMGTPAPSPFTFMNTPSFFPATSPHQMQASTSGNKYAIISSSPGQQREFFVDSFIIQFVACLERLLQT